MSIFGDNGTNSSSGGDNYFHNMLQYLLANAKVDQQNAEWLKEADDAAKIAAIAPELFQGMTVDNASFEGFGAPNEHGIADPRMSPTYQAQVKAYQKALASGSPLLQKMVMANMGEMARANLVSADKLVQDPTKMLTDDIKEYQYAQQSGYGGTFEQWVMDTKRAGATQIGATTNNVSTQTPAFEKKYDEEMGKAEFEEFQKLTKAPDSINSQLQKFDVINQYLGDRGGFAGSQLADLKALADRFGIPIEGKDADQAAIALQNEVALDLRNTSNGAGMPGALSDADREYLRKQVPGIDMSPAGRGKLIEVKRKLYQRSLETRDAAIAYANRNNGRFDYRFYNSPEYLQLRDKPLFDRLDIASPSVETQAPFGGTVSDLPFIRSKEEYDRYPAGTVYIDGRDGKQKRKGN